MKIMFKWNFKNNTLKAETAPSEIPIHTTQDGHCVWKITEHTV